MLRSASTNPAELYTAGELVPHRACPTCNQRRVAVATRTERFVYLRCLGCAEIWSEPRYQERTREDEPGSPASVLRQAVGEP